MNLVMKFDIGDELRLPINYSQFIQSNIYSHLKHNEKYGAYHDSAYRDGNRDFKLFTFSNLQGSYQILGDEIIFCDEVCLELRSIDLDLLDILYCGIKEKGLRLGGRSLLASEISKVEKKIAKEDILVYMKTPIVCHKTEKGTKKTVFYRPCDREFKQLIERNFMRKYRAYAGNSEASISVETFRFSEKDKVVAKYKDFCITGWKGVYRLKGAKEYLNFLYYVGLGSKNSQGFGMFELLPAKK